MEKQKNILIDGYVRLGCAQVDILGEKQRPAGSQETGVVSSSSSPPASAAPPVSLTDVDNTVKELVKWTDITDSKVGLSKRSSSHQTHSGFL